MKTSEKLYEEVKWIQLSTDLAYELIEQDKILDCRYLLKECEKRAVKRGNYCLNDRGAMQIMLILYASCTPQQLKNVDLLYEEYFLRMHPAWYCHAGIWRNRIAAYRRCGTDPSDIIQQFEVRLNAGRFGQKAKNKYLEAKNKCSQ